MKNIIIRMPNFIGDSINTLPAIDLLKQEYPDSRITLLGLSFIKDIFEHDPRIDDFICFEKGRKNYLTFVKRIYQGKYDLGILFTNTFISVFIFKLALVKCLIGYKNEGRGFLLDFKMPLNRNVHYINRYAMLVNKYFNNKYIYLPPLRLFYKQEKTFYFPDNKQVIGLYLGGINKKYRRYPESLSLELLKLLNGYNLVLIGDRNDAGIHASYLKRVKLDSVINLTGKTSVGEFVTTIANLDALITIDSSAMHIAAAVHTKFVALLGLSTSPTSTILPKVDFGIALKVENNMINEEDYIRNITPRMIVDHVELLLNRED